MDQPAEQEPTQAVADAAPAPSTDAQEAESNSVDSWIRGGLRRLGFGGSSPASPEDQATEESTDAGAPTEPAWTPPASKDEFDRAIQSEVDRRQAKWQRELQQQQTAQRSQEDWERIKAMARGGDKWALGEIAEQEVLQRAEQEDKDAAYGQFLSSHVPIFDRTYLDPMLAGLGEETWKPIVGEGLTTLEERTAAVPKIVAAHRERAVADALTSEPFVKKLLASSSFRAAWQKSPVVREQFLAHLRGDVPEPDAPSGVARGARPRDEDAEMDGMIRAARGSLRRTFADRVSSARNEDL